MSIKWKKMHFSHSKHLKHVVGYVACLKEMNTECSSDPKHKREKLKIHELDSASQSF